MQTTKIRMLSMVTHNPRWVSPGDVLDAGAYTTEERRRMQNAGSAEWCTEELGDEYVDHFVRIPPDSRVS